MDINAVVHTPSVEAAIRGRFDVHAIDDFVTAVTDRLAPEAPNAIIDLAEVEFMDSSALAALVRALKRSAELGGAVVLVRVSHTARIILELTRLEQIFERADSVEAARSRLAPAFAS